MRNRKLKAALLATAAMIGVAATVASTASMAGKAAAVSGADALTTKTPIKHLVVVFNENVAFDHYFGTYPNALNVDGEPAFKPAKGTQTDINNFLSNPSLLDNNPNLNQANSGISPNNQEASVASNPFRLDRTQASTSDQDHGYTPEQEAYDGGKNDLFPLDVGQGSSGGAGGFGNNAQVMGYFDGNTVTAFWNYAQNYAMSDNAWTDNFGPSTPGALSMFAGQTNGLTIPVGVPAGTPASVVGQLLAAADAGTANSDGSFTLISDIDPAGDVCSSPSIQVQMTAKNIGDMLNQGSIPWGSFVGGFNLQTINANGSTGCNRSTVSPVTGGSPGDYVPHHIWFQYYTSTANPTHARPTSTKAIGYTVVPGTKKVDPANHAYDLDDFFTAVGSGNYPAVSFIKMQSYEDGHPGNSNPLDEQTGLVNLVNFLQAQPDWDSTAIVVAYDDSDGWYDHASAPISHPSFSTAQETVTTVPVALDVLNGAGICGTVGMTEPAGIGGMPVHGRCGPGTRTPFLVISPYAKKNYVSHVQITQSSIPQFIEDNWLNGQRIGGGSFDATTGSIMDMFNFDKKNDIQVLLDPTTGTVDDKTKTSN
jgi:phospholipase C